MSYISATKNTGRIQGVTIVCKPGSDVQGVDILHTSFSSQRARHTHRAGHMRGLLPGESVLVLVSTTQCGRKQHPLMSLFLKMANYPPQINHHEPLTQGSLIAAVIAMATSTSTYITASISFHLGLLVTKGQMCFSWGNKKLIFV